LKIDSLESYSDIKSYKEQYNPSGQLPGTPYGAISSFLALIAFFGIGGKFGDY